MKNSKWHLACSVSELESLGLQTPKLNELNDSFTYYRGVYSEGYTS